MLAPRLPLQCLSILSPTATHLPASGDTGVRGKVQEHQARCSLWVSPGLSLYAWALSLGTECCLWVVYPLQVTRVLWEILRLPWCPEPFMEYAPHLLVALLYQVFISTEEMPEEIDTFWKKCQEEHDLPTSGNRCSIPVLLSLPHPRADA